MRRNLLLIGGIVVVLAVAAGVWWWLGQGPNGKAVRVEQAEPEKIEQAEAERPTPTADIGGPFILTAHTGERLSDQDLRGRFLLIFFGFTHCPDVCPMALGTVAAVMEALDDLAARLQPLFITVDPERDTPEVLREYVANFHSSIIGLTGTPEEIENVAKAYRVFYRKVVPEGGDPEHYLIDHSAYLYLVDPDGRFVRVFSHTQSSEEIAAALKEILAG